MHLELDLLYTDASDRTRKIDISYLSAGDEIELLVVKLNAWEALVFIVYPLLLQPPEDLFFIIRIENWIDVCKF